MSNVKKVVIPAAGLGTKIPSRYKSKPQRNVDRG